MYYFSCDTCKSTQKGWMLSILTNYVDNTVKKVYKCDTCRKNTSVFLDLPEMQRVDIPKDYQASW